MKRIFIVLMVLLFSHTVLHAQMITIEGKLSGTKEATISTTANPAAIQKTSEGSFSIAIRSTGDTLVVRSTGYDTQLIHVDASTSLPIQITLSQTVKAMDEVIVNTGYQRLPRERQTGSFTIIDNKQLNQQVGTTVLEKLESIANGLYVDRQTSTQGKPRIIIRGLSTINGPASPLIVLDDFPYEGDLNNINPNDVESITILKDAAAASIWGTRAGNGVIVITTKRGRFNQPMRVEFTSNLTITEKPALRQIKNISSGDFVSVEQFLYAKGYYAGQLNGSPWKGVSPVVELLYQRDQGKITAQEAETRIAAIAKYNLTDELLNYIYDKGTNLQQAISLTGGSKNMSWSFGGGWDRNSDQLNNRYNRYNLKSMQNFRLTPKLEINAGIDYTQSENIRGRQGYGLATNTGYLPVYTQIRDEAGNALPVNLDYRQVYADSAGEGKLLDWSYYPLTDADHIDERVKQQAIIASIGASYQVFKGFSLSLKYQYGRQVSSGTTIYDEGSYLTRNNINSFTSFDPDGNVVYNLPRGSTLYNSNAILETQNFRAQGSYTNAWGAHALTAIAGGEWRQAEMDNNSSSSVGFNSDLYTINTQLDALNPFPNFLSGLGMYMPIGQVYGGTTNVNISFFGNAAYTFRNKYTASVSARKDASNIFGATRNNRWTPLWSAGLAWDISRENFYKVRWMPSIKLRATYGVSGNADPLRSAVTTLKPQYISPFTNLTVSQIAQYENKRLGWEYVKMANIGLDFSIFNNRISGSIEYYHKKATGLFGFAQVDPTTISTSYLEKNVADIKGHGWDIILNSRNITGRLSWTTQLNLNLNRDEVVHYYLLNQTGASFIGGGVSAIEGAPVYGLYSYQWAGLDPLSGDPQGYVEGAISKDYDAIINSAGTIANLTYSGPVLPTAVLSIGNTLSWKGFSLSVRITGKFGNYFRRPSINYSDLFRMRKGHSDFALRWQQPGDEMITNVPSMQYPINSARDAFYNGSAVLVSKADFIRLQYINLGYTFKKFQVYVNANNLGLLWKANKFDIDPEYNATYSVPANIALGFKATF